MKITPEVFDAYLKCPTKCWLRASGEVSEENPYAQWVKTQTDSYREAETTRMVADLPDSEVDRSPSAENTKSATWRLATGMTVQAEMGACVLESELHAVERVSAGGRGKAAQFIPIRFIFTNKLGKDDKLLLGFDAVALAKMQKREISLGKIVHGDDHIMIRVKTAALVGEVRKRVENITALLSNPETPDLILNRHCAECEYQPRCRKIAFEKDDLSLLARMDEKERKKLHSKGIFTVTQLSYTFRPRRRPKRMLDKREKYHHSLKALAIREKKIHIVGSPELKIEGTPVYLDVEGLPDRDFYYLIGLRIDNGESTIQHSLWADTIADEARIWRKFLAILDTVEKPMLIHYGSYETIFLKRMKERHSGLHDDSDTAKAIALSLNLLSELFAKIYFPTYSNGLKDIACHLGFEWSSAIQSGVQTIAWRDRWSTHANSSEQQELVSYNAEDCEALEKVTQAVCGLNQPCSDTADSSLRDIVDVTTMKREHPYGFKRNAFFFPDLDVINKAAYWDYQREKVYIKSNRRLSRKSKTATRSLKGLSPNKHIQCLPPTECPHCGSKRIQGYDSSKRIIRDLKFTSSGVKRWIVCYHFLRHICRRCERVFCPPTQDFSGSKFGTSLLAYSVYQNIELRLPQESIDRSINALFHLRLAQCTAGRLKSRASQIYAATYESLLEKLKVGAFLHVDETKISIRGNDGFVWVLANMNEVAYVYTESRESEWIQIFLKDFNGVLVSDFYAGYDAACCPKQRCLVHLLRDLNDDLHKNPFDEDLKRIGKAFADLVRPMIDTVGRFGLKSRFLKKHLPAVQRFYRELSRTDTASETSRKIKRRFESNREELFTFLRYDGVPWNNNNAEHAIKAFAMLRHVIKGVTSEKGIKEYLVLLSVCQTCKCLGVEFLDFLRSGEKDVHAFAESRSRLKRTKANEAGIYH